MNRISVLYHRRAAHPMKHLEYAAGDDNYKDIFLLKKIQIIMHKKRQIYMRQPCDSMKQPF